MKRQKKRKNDVQVVYKCKLHAMSVRIAHEYS